MSDIYVFDVDGTLTSQGCFIEQEFSNLFYEFCAVNPTYLVSGNDYPKLRRQLPANILHKCRGIYACAGSHYFEQGNQIYNREHQFAPELIEFCQDFIAKSGYLFREGNHLEYRTGLLNISVVGREANEDQRSYYQKWNCKMREQEAFVTEINTRFDDYEAVIGGNISIDVMPTGWNKSLVMKDLLEQHPAARITFYGNRIQENGSDLPLAEALDDGTGRHKSLSVDNYKDTWRLMGCMIKRIAAKNMASLLIRNIENTKTRAINSLGQIRLRPRFLSCDKSSKD